MSFYPFFILALFSSTMKAALITIFALGLVSALSGPVPTPTHKKRELFKGNLFKGLNGIGLNNQDIEDLVDQLGLDLDSDDLFNLSSSQLNCDILHLLSLMGLGGTMDVFGLGLNFNQQLVMLGALEQLAQFHALGLINQKDILGVLNNNLFLNKGKFSNFGESTMLEERKAPPQRPS